MGTDGRAEQRADDDRRGDLELAQREIGFFGNGRFVRTR